MAIIISLSPTGLGLYKGTETKSRAITIRLFPIGLGLYQGTEHGYNYQLIPNRVGLIPGH